MLAERTDSPRHIDLLTAGFPCQPFSTAARGRNNARDWWPEALEIIRCVRPLWVILENVPGRRFEHLERACDDLEAIDYAVWPLDIAVEIKNHVRRRGWIVAHADSEGEPQCPIDAEMAGLQEAARRWRNISEPMGMDDGIPGKTHRMRALGNAIRVYEAEMLIRAITTVCQGQNHE